MHENTSNECDVRWQDTLSSMSWPYRMVRPNLRVAFTTWHSRHVHKLVTPFAKFEAGDCLATASTPLQLAYDLMCVNDSVIQAYST